MKWLPWDVIPPKVKEQYVKDAIMILIVCAGVCFLFYARSGA